MSIAQRRTLKIQVHKIYVWLVILVVMNVQAIQVHAQHVTQTIIYMNKRVGQHVQLTILRMKSHGHACCAHSGV